jgi:hypothetical protein
LPARNGQWFHRLKNSHPTTGFTTFMCRRSGGCAPFIRVASAAGERIGGLEELKKRLSVQKFEETFIEHLAQLGIPSRHRSTT